MKRTLLLATTLILGAMAFPATARADWHVGVGVGFGGGYVHGGYYPGHVRRHSPPAHVHVRAPLYREVWVPPTYDRVVVGYTCWGRPIFRTVCVRHGHYRKVLVGYTCTGCGVACP